MAKPFKSRFKSKCCGDVLMKIPFHNEYFCNTCFKRFSLPHDKARKENMKTYLDSGRIMNKGVFRNGEVWYR